MRWASLVLFVPAAGACGNNGNEIKAKHQLPQTVTVEQGQDLLSITNSLCGLTPTFLADNGVGFVLRRWLRPPENESLHEPGRLQQHSGVGAVFIVHPGETFAVPSTLCDIPRMPGPRELIGFISAVVIGIIGCNLGYPYYLRRRGKPV